MSESTGATGLTATNHYADSSDSPVWTANSDNSWTRNVPGIDGGLAAIVDNTGKQELQLTDPHGDIVATTPNSSTATGVDSYNESTEFGAPRSGTSAKYGWLGGKQRSTDTLGGIVLMGVRLYAPALGRFLQTDPIPGGSANAYDYAGQDPINSYDLDGRMVDPEGIFHPGPVPDAPRGAPKMNPYDWEQLQRQKKGLPADQKAAARAKKLQGTTWEKYRGKHGSKTRGGPNKKGGGQQNFWHDYFDWSWPNFSWPTIDGCGRDTLACSL